MIRGLARTVSRRLGTWPRGPRVQRAWELGELFLQSVQAKRTFASLEDEVTAVIGLLPDERPVIVDAGAHRGEWTRAMLRRIGDRRPRMLLIEPASVNLQTLRALEGERIAVLPYALSDRVGSASLHTSEIAPYLPSLFERRIEHEPVRMTGTERVRTVALDALMEERGLDRIDLLKMDIEGAELLALRGASRALARAALGAVTFEVGAANVDGGGFFKDYWCLFGGFGYRVFRIMHGGWLLPVGEYRESLECFQKSNYVAVSPAVAARAGVGAHAVAEAV